MTATEVTAYVTTFAPAPSLCLLTLWGWDDPDRDGDGVDYFADPAVTVAVTAISAVARLNQGSACIRL